MSVALRSAQRLVQLNTHASTIAFVALLWIGGTSGAHAQVETPANNDSPALLLPGATSALKTMPAEERNRAELLESYQFLREQLRSAQVAIANNRVDAQETIRQQTADLTTKLEAMRATVAAVNKRQQEDAFRFEYERIHRQEASQRSDRSLLWFAGIAGTALLLTLAIMARLQSRAMNRIAEAVTAHPRLLAQNGGGWLPSGAHSLSEKAVAESNQRLTSAMERIERRIGHLEHTANPPVPTRERRVFPADP